MEKKCEKICKEAIEYIVDRKLTDFEYKFIANYLIAKRQNKKMVIFFGRHQGRVLLFNDTMMLNKILPYEIEFIDI